MLVKKLIFLLALGMVSQGVLAQGQDAFEAELRAIFSKATSVPEQSLAVTYSSWSDEASQGPSRLQEALRRTQYPFAFHRMKAIFLNIYSYQNEISILRSSTWNGTNLHIQIGLNQPIEEWIIAFSRNPEAEPKLRYYFVQKPERLTRVRAEQSRQLMLDRLATSLRYDRNHDIEKDYGQSDQSYIDDLQTLTKALTLVKFPRDFSKVKGMKFGDRALVKTSGSRQPLYHLEFPSGGTVEDYMAIASASGDQEPALRSYFTLHPECRVLYELPRIESAVLAKAEKTLKENDWCGVSIWRGDNLEDHDYVQALLKAARALDEVVYPKKYGGCVVLSVDVTDFNLKSENSFGLSLPAGASYQAMIGVLSAYPENEPVFQAYLKHDWSLQLAEKSQLGDIDRERSLKTQISRLERETTAILRTRYGWTPKWAYQTTAVGRWGYTGEAEYLASLEKLKCALATTKHPRAVGTGTIYITDQEISDRAAGGKDIYLSYRVSADGFVEKLSSMPGDEPRLQGYQRSRQDVVRNQLGPLFPYHETGRQILCEVRSLENLKENGRAAALIQRIAGDEIRDIRNEIFGPDKVISFVRNSDVEVGLDGSAHVRGIWSAKAVEVRRRSKRDPKRFLLVSRVSVDDGCNFLEAEFRNYNGMDKLASRSHVSSEDGKLSVVEPAKPEIKPLEEIYKGEGRFQGKSYAELLEIAKRTDRILVTVLDLGIDYNHPALAFRVPRRSGDNSAAEQTASSTEKGVISNLWNYVKSWWPTGEWTKSEDSGELSAARATGVQSMSQAIGWDFDEDDDKPYDYGLYFWQDIFTGRFANHGSHVAGIIGRDDPNIALLPVRYPHREGAKFYDAVAFAHGRGSRIVNISLGSDEEEFWRGLKKAIRDYRDMLFVIAAGNDNGRDIDIFPTYPAAYDFENMLVVASLNSLGHLSDFSSVGKKAVDVAARGEDVWSAIPGNAGEKSGTSMATSEVTSLAAQISWIDRDLDPCQIISLIGNTVDRSDEFKDKVRFGGVVNRARALARAADIKKGEYPLPAECSR